jgi:hypothetical protein
MSYKLDSNDDEAVKILQVIKAAPVLHFMSMNKKECDMNASQNQAVNIAKTNIAACKKVGKTPVHGRTIKEKADCLTGIFRAQKANLFQNQC